MHPYQIVWLIKGLNNLIVKRCYADFHRNVVYKSFVFINLKFKQSVLDVALLSLVYTPIVVTSHYNWLRAWD